MSDETPVATRQLLLEGELLLLRDKWRQKSGGMWGKSQLSRWESLFSRLELLHSHRDKAAASFPRLSIHLLTCPEYRSMIIVIYESTVLSSLDYACQVIRRMPTWASNAIKFSLRQDFPDA